MLSFPFIVFIVLVSEPQFKTQFIVDAPLLTPNFMERNSIRILPSNFLFALTKSLSGRVLSNQFSFNHSLYSCENFNFKHFKSFGVAVKIINFKIVGCFGLPTKREMMQSKLILKRIILAENYVTQHSNFCTFLPSSIHHNQRSQVPCFHYI